jgi:uncharacterized protein YfeS
VNPTIEDRVVVLEAVAALLLMPLTRKLKDANRLNAHLRSLPEIYEGDEGRDRWYRIETAIDDLTAFSRNTDLGPDGVLRLRRE